jgi:hypothetical protein
MSYRETVGGRIWERFSIQLDAALRDRDIRFKSM